ncbi:MAG: potassium channel protein [Flavobacteriia bacterium]|nr:potassium channel protein [Flavobacteriia bacterium]
MWKDFQLFGRVFYFISLILIGLGIGTVGYMKIEGWNFLDSLYMSVITTTTVGFTEVNQLSEYGRVFTMFLIFFSFGTFAFALTSITRFIVGGEYKKTLIEYRFNKRLNIMENHVIICGYGRVGKQVAEDLNLQKIPILVIENKQEIIEKSIISKTFLFLTGDATQDETIESSFINKARAIITCLPKDSDNLYVVLAARELRKDIPIIARASNQHAVSKLKLGGANHVIMPDVIGGAHMASIITSPDVMEFMDNIKAQGIEGVNIESISFNELPSEFQNKSIKELESKKLTGVTIIGYKSPDGSYIINPDWETIVVKNSKLFVLGNQQQIKAFNEMFLHKQKV